MHIPTSLAALFLLGPIAAQAVTTTIAAPQNLRCSVEGFVLTGDFFPAGPLPPTGSVTATQAAFGNGLATTSWELDSSATGASLHISSSVSATADPGVNFRATAGTNYFSIASTSQLQVGARLRIWQDLQIGPNSSTPPSVQIDFGNDGTIDVPSLSLAGPQIVTVPDLSGSPLAARIIVHCEQSGPGSSQVDVYAVIEPDGPISVTKTATSCLSGGDFDIAPTFEQTGVEVTSSYVPSVVVFGFAQQPVALPVTPCLLMPTPDVLVGMTPGQPLFVALPPSLRPLVLYAQLATIDGQGILTSDAYQMLAL